MGQASSSSAADSTINSTGGNIAAGSNSLPWIVLGIVAVVGLLVWWKTRK